MSRLLSAVMPPAFSVDLVFVAVVAIPSLSPMGLKAFFRFCGFLWCAVYEGDFTGLELITDTDNQLSDRGTAFHTLHFIVEITCCTHVDFRYSKQQLALKLLFPGSNTYLRKSVFIGEQQM